MAPRMSRSSRKYRKALRNYYRTASAVNRLRRKGLMKSMTSNYQVHSFKRSTHIGYYQPVNNGGMNQSAVYPENGSYTWMLTHGFTLAALPNFTEFQNLFDQYMITGVKISLLPIYNSVSSTDVSPGVNPKVGAIPYLTYAIDKDGTFPTTLQTLNQYASSKTILFDKPVNVYIKAPAFKDNTTSSNGVALFQNKWIDTVNSTVNHLGLVWALSFPYDTNTLVEPWGVQVRATYYFKCKTVR